PPDEISVRLGTLAWRTAGTGPGVSGAQSLNHSITRSGASGEHGPEEIVQEQVLRIELLPRFEVGPQRVLVAGGREVVDRAVPRLVDVGNSAVLRGDLVEGPAEGMPVRITGVRIGGIDRQHVGTA